MAFLAAQQAEWLAGLRLNQHAEVIQQMETAMDATVAALAAYASVKPADETTRKMRDRFLVPVKVYHDSYAPPAETAAVVKGFLAKIPPRDPTSACGSAICRLDDLRLASNKTSAPKP